MKKRSLTFMFVLFACSFSVIAQSVEKEEESKKPKNEEPVSKEKAETPDKSKKPKVAKLNIKKPKPKAKESIKEYLNEDPKALKSEKKTAEEKPKANADNTAETKTAVKPEKKELVDKYEAQISFTVDSLTNNFGVWTQASLFAKRKFEDGKIVWGEYRVSERRSIRDREIYGGFYHPFKNKFGYTVEASYSNTNEFVGKYSVRGEVEKIFKKGWVGHLGAKHKSYGRVKVSTLYGQVEKYWGNNRVAYTANFTSVSNAGTSPSNSISYHRYYGERINSYGVRFSFGNEEEFVDRSIGILRTNTVSVTGSFKRWINDDFGILLNGTLHRQGEFYYRRGLNFGVIYKF